MFCNHCGRNVDENQKFCNECGGKLTIEESMKIGVLEKKSVEQVDKVKVKNPQQSEENLKKLDKTNFITTKKNLMILCSLIGFACMLLPFAKIMGSSYSAFSILNFNSEVSGMFVVVFLFYCCSCFWVLMSRLKTAQCGCGLGALLLFFILLNTESSVMYSLGIGAWLMAIFGALVSLSGVIAKHYYKKNPLKAFKLPSVVKIIWIAVFIVIFLIVLSSNAASDIIN